MNESCEWRIVNTEGIGVQCEERSRASQPPLIRELRPVCKKSASAALNLVSECRASCRNLDLTSLAEWRVVCKAGTTEKQTPRYLGFRVVDGIEHQATFLNEGGSVSRRAARQGRLAAQHPGPRRATSSPTASLSARRVDVAEAQCRQALKKLRGFA